MRALRQSWTKNWPDVRATLTGGFPRFVLGNPSSNTDGIPVFCYHRTTRATIEADLAYLKNNGYHTLTLPAFLEVLRGGSFDEKAVVLTVDDGAINLYDTLFPTLKTFDAHAIAFVAAGMHDDQYPGLDDASRPCTWTELREMEGSGHIDVQAHTWSHRYIPRWPMRVDLVGIDPAHSRARQEEALSLRDDLERGRRVLEEQLSKTVTHLAFPMYNGTSECIQIARDLGYESFWWGALPGRRANRPGDPLTHIPRISAEFIHRLPGTPRRTIRQVLSNRLHARTLL